VRSPEKEDDVAYLSRCKPDNRLRKKDMRIDIDQLTEAELIDLNHRVVERLRFLDQMRSHAEMLEFRIGDRVTFQPDGRAPVVGMLTKYNRKSVTVITDEGHKWNVAPSFLKKYGASGEREDIPGSNVVRLR
jgi:hypothetical protein